MHLFDLSRLNRSHPNKEQTVALLGGLKQLDDPESRAGKRLRLSAIASAITVIWALQMPLG